MGLIFWSGSRGASYAIGAGYVAVALFCSRLRLTSAWIPALAACVLGALAAHSLGTPMEGMGVGRMAQQENFSSARTDLWLSSLRSVGERPWFGHGEGQTIHVVAFAIEHRTFSPHNIFIKTLLAWGVVGTLLIVALGGHGGSLRVCRSRTARVVALALALAVTVAYSMIDGTLYYVLTTGIFAACAGAVLAATSAESRPRFVAPTKDGSRSSAGQTECPLPTHCGSSRFA